MEEPGPDEAADEDLQPVYSRIEAGDVAESNVAGRDITQIVNNYQGMDEEDGPLAHGARGARSLRFHLTWIFQRLVAASR